MKKIRLLQYVSSCKSHNHITLCYKCIMWSASMKISSGWIAFLLKQGHSSCVFNIFEGEQNDAFHKKIVWWCITVSFMQHTIRYIHTIRHTACLISRAESWIITLREYNLYGTLCKNSRSWNLKHLQVKGYLLIAADSCAILPVFFLLERVFFKKWTLFNLCLPAKFRKFVEVFSFKYVTLLGYEIQKNVSKFNYW